MFNFTKKKTIIGIIGCILSICLAILLINLSPTGHIKELPFPGVLLRLLSILFIASSVGFLALIFTNVKGYLYIFGIFVIMPSFKVLTDLTSTTSPHVALYIISLVGIIALIVSSYKQYKNNTLAINEENVSSNKKIDEQEIFEDALDINDTNAFNKNFIIIGTHVAGTLFQVIKADDSFFFHHVGNILTGIDQSKIISDFSDIESCKDNKKDYVICFKDIDVINARIKNNPSLMDFGSLHINLKNGKTKKYGLINLFEEHELKSFFNNNITITRKSKNASERKKHITNKDKDKLNFLNKFFFIFSIISSVIFGIYFVYYNKIAHAILTTLCIIICLTPFILYIKYPNYLSIKDTSRDELYFQDRKINIIQNVFIFPVVLCIICIFECEIFSYYNYSMLLIYSVILLTIFILIMLTITKEYKKEKSAMITIIFIGLFLCFSITHMVNTAYDFSSPQVISCQITDNPTWTNNNDETTYYLTFKYKDENIKTEVKKETYETYKVGDNIAVIKQQGLLNIESLILYE